MKSCCTIFLYLALFRPTQISTLSKVPRNTCQHRKLSRANQGCTDVGLRESESERAREREREPKNMFNKSNACGLGGGGGGVVAKICIWSLRQPPPTTRRNRALCSKAPCVSRVLIKDLISRNRRPSSGGSFSRCSIPEGTESSRLSHAAATMLGVRGRRSIAVIATLLHSWASAAKLTC